MDTIGNGVIVDCEEGIVSILERDSLRLPNLPLGTSQRVLHRSTLESVKPL